MTKHLAESELILNDDGSVYHLHLKPQDVGETILLVGDPDRVGEVSKYFDRIELKKQKREFVTHTGFVGKKRVSVISTGIGTDNIDIVLNELDLLVNVNLKTREVKPVHTSLPIIRIGTSGALQADINVDDILFSTHGLGLDSLMHFYEYEEPEDIADLLTAIDEQLNLVFVNPYLFPASEELVKLFSTYGKMGITATCCGFYAPQGRVLKVDTTRFEDLITRLQNVKVNDYRVTNFEMETAGIYGLASVLGHRALSVNAILANRISHKFSTKPHETVDKAIKMVLEKVENIL